MAKRIMRDFALDEISAVTAPAQKGARMVIMKRDDSAIGKKPVVDTAAKAAAEAAEVVRKGKFLMTERDATGHSHLIDVDDFVLLRGGGYTTSVCEGERYHSHPFTIAKGVVTIGDAGGHTHRVADVSKSAAPGEPAPIVKTETEGTDDMTEQEIAKLRALASMSDSTKAHFGKLSGAEAEAFAAMSEGDRVAVINKANDANPVVFKAKDGAEYRASDDPRMVALAKQNDSLVVALGAITEQGIEAEAKKLAAEWVHLGKPLEEKITLAKSILGLPEEAKKAALDGINAGAAAMAPIFKTFGALGGGNVGTSGTAVEKLDDLAKARQKAVPTETYAQAYDVVVRSPEGSALYSETVRH